MPFPRGAKQHKLENQSKMILHATRPFRGITFTAILGLGSVLSATGAILPLDLNPPVTQLEFPSVRPVQVTSEPGADTLENGWYRLTIGTENGLEIRELRHLPGDVSPVQPDPGSPIFALQIGDETVDSRGFRVVSTTRPAAARGGGALRYQLENDAGLWADVEFRANDGPQLRISLALRNTSDAPLDVSPAFPILTGIAWGEDPTDDYFFYPYLTGILSKLPVGLANAYGGELVYFQMMASYRPDRGAGLFLNAADPGGEYKILHFDKLNETGSAPAFSFRSANEAMEHGRLERDHVFQNPYKTAGGTSMAFSYQKRTLEPNERWSLPTAMLGVYNGDWRQAMEAYRSWFESFAHRRPHPGKLIDRFNLEGTSAAHHFHNANGYNTDIGQWGHIPVFEEGEHADEYLAAPLDMVEHTSYWEWDVITDEYLEKHRKTAIEQAGHTNVVTLERSAVIRGEEYSFHDKGNPSLEGTRYFWGNQGDYGLQGYNERWGGLPAFRGYLDEMKRKGYLVTLYINVSEAALSSLVGAKHGPEWGLMEKRETWAEPRYQWPMGAMWGMDMNNPGWRDYIAETCRRLVVETGADGIRIDVMGACHPICYNDRHPHTFGRPGHQADQQAQLEAARQVRMAVDQVDPDTVLMTENPGIDLFWQYFDGTLSYDLSEWRGILPTFGKIEGFVGINVARFYFPRFKIFDYQVFSKVPEWRLFNATGAFNREWCFSAKELAVMQENADAFGALYPEPMIPTLMPQVYANAFPAGEKTVYTIYNARSTAVEGDLLRMKSDDGEHFVDLLRAEEISVKRAKGHAVVPIQLPPRTAAIMARLPRVAQVKWNKNNVVVRLPEGSEGFTGKLVSERGDVLSEFEPKDGKNRVPIPRGEHSALMLRILKNGRLVDASVHGAPGS